MIKQVIVIRKDLNMRRGKECAQVAHASMTFLMKKVIDNIRSSHNADISITTVEWEWMTNNFAKIVLQVNSEEELLELYKKAKGESLEAHLIKDLGLTELKVPTYTCMAIGPDESHLIDKITSHLRLY